MSAPDSSRLPSSDVFHSSAALDIYLLGLVEFDAVLALQRMIIDDLHTRSDRFGVLLICEHPPAVSIGRDGTIADLQADSSHLTARQLDVRYVDRSGGVIQHGPGQIACYLMLPLNRLGLPGRAFRSHLLAVLNAVANEQGIPTWPAASLSAVECRCGQFAWLGFSDTDGISSFGFVLNVTPDVVGQRQVQPVPSGSAIASLSMQKMRVVSMPKVREAIVRHISADFGYSSFHIHTRHPLLKRTVRKVPADVPDESPQVYGVRN